MNIKPFESRHLDTVVQIEKAAGDVSWNRDHFEKELRLPISRFFVVEQEGTVVGYGGFWKVEQEAQLTNLVIDAAYRRCHWGEALLTHLIESAHREGCGRMTLDVREGNHPARALYQKLGFRFTGRRPRLYACPDEDALLMEKDL